MQLSKHNFNHFSHEINITVKCSQCFQISSCTEDNIIDNQLVTKQ